MVAQPIMSLAEQVRQYVRAEIYRDVKSLTFLKEDPAGAKRVYAKLHPAFEGLHIDRSNRLIFLRELYGRHNIDSFGDITFAEATALLRFQVTLKVLYDQTLHG